MKRAVGKVPEVVVSSQDKILAGIRPKVDQLSLTTATLERYATELTTECLVHGWAYAAPPGAVNTQRYSASNMPLCIYRFSAAEMQAFATPRKNAVRLP